MTPDLLFVLAQANLAGTAGALAVIALRKPARQLFGARAAYHLWALVPLAAAASFLPPRSAELAPAPVAAMAPANLVAAAGEDLSDLFSTAPVAVTHAAAGVSPVLAVCVLWALGLVLMAAWLARRQLQFMGDLKRGDAGPAVIGFFKPRIITPSDFEERFNSREQTVVLAHEKIHLARHDARINAFVALARCVCWFNPLVHLSAHLMRIDQELACDAAVVERHPKARKPYAQALLKAQLAARPLPLGCYWPAGTEHPLTERIAMLKRSNPSRPRRLAGAALVTVLGLAASYAAWAAAPAAAPAIEAPLNYIADAPSLEPAPAPLPAPASATLPEGAPVALEPVAQTATGPSLATPGPHVFATYFDGDQPATVTGTVVSVDYSGTYAEVYVKANQVTSLTGDPSGTVSDTGATTADSHLWQVEGPQVSLLSAADQASVQVGSQVNVLGYRAKDSSCSPACGLNGRMTKYPDGSLMFGGARPDLTKVSSATCLTASVAMSQGAKNACAQFKDAAAKACGTMPTFQPPADAQPNPTLWRNTQVAAWNADCDAKMASAQGGPVTHAFTSNSVKREGAP
jgi:beta-lactamase regulating signal transducer with metallopeptidase domain